MAGYSRDFLIDAFLSRYTRCTLISIETLVRLESMANDLYDRVGRDNFQTYASLDAEALRVYKNRVD